MPRSEFPNVKSGRHNERRLVEPGVDRRVLELAVADAIRPLPARARIRHVARHSRRERKTAAIVDDALGLPPAEEPVHECSSLAEEPLSPAERQFSTEAHGQQMRNVEGGRPVSYVKLPPMPGAGTVVVSATTYATREYHKPPDVLFWNFVCSA